MMKKDNNGIVPSEEPKGDIILYTNEDGSVRLDVQIDGDTVWLTKGQMALLFGRDRTVIGRHIANVFEQGEVNPEVGCAKFAHTTQHGAIEGKEQTSLVDHYNLDVIISVGYRVHSIQGVRFRHWATQRLKEYLIKGFTIDADRLKGNGGGQYWYELLNTIKDIRSSEKVLYRQVLDLYATSVDYSAKDEETLLFFKMVQNKLHYATHGQTAAEVIFNRADAEKEFMGLTTFRGTHPTQADVVVAKNYLNETELRVLNNLVSGYFDFAENRALNHIPTTMHDYRVMLDNILSAGGNKVLADAGSVSVADARAKAIEEYRKFQVRTLSPVERDYIAALEAEAKKAKK